ncbi:Transmembrane emp24 domain-containing protein 9 [Perkinsus olseni]|uniref:Transmembrane emp24 domain-containing protein 9 n=1 Tax=Perkinsus olseni TaxID=32597 RepID=A0A7J6LQZ0_PEROL|nr:Transmembrane emp24 domain-containing protein 9 [Perkinsus olseni]KAF4667239.1 Transmembrane emp24 domain-containing protein 9 [Perkinsus olseni]
MTTVSSFELTDDEMTRIAEEADIGFKASSACEAMTLEFAKYKAPLAFMMIKLATIGIIGFVSHLSEVAALFFELKPHAQVECFGLPEVDSGSVIEGSYDSVGRNGYEGVVATVTRVDGGTPSSVWEGHDHKGRLAVPVSQPGTYKLCFASRTKGVQTVSFSLRIEKKSDSQNGSRGGDQAATTDHTNELKYLVEILKSKVDTLMDQQRYSVAREAVHRNTAESTNSRVLWWTVAHLSSVLILAALQLHYMRAFLEIKQII